MSDQARPPRMRFPKIEGSPLLSNDEAQALRAVLLGLDPMDTSGNPPSLDIWLAARDFYRSPEAVERLRGALGGLVESGVEFDDERLDYVIMQVDRNDLAEARAALDATRENQ